MQSFVLKITLSVSVLILIAVAGMTYLSANSVVHLFQQYILNSIKIHDAFPYVKGHHIVVGPVEKEFLRQTYIRLMLISTPTILCAFALGYIIARRLAAPLKRLSSWAREIARGNLDIKANIKADKEFRDLITSFELMADELGKAQMLRKQLFADTAHELKTPITVIRGNLEGMRDGIIPASREMIESLIEETEYLTTVINDIKYLALADSGHLILDRKESNVNDLVRKCITSVLSAAKTKKIDVSFDTTSDPLMANVDPERLSQVIYNLFVNAGKYTSGGGKINLRTELFDDDGVPSFKITVSDSGIGISADDLPYVFERFYRADKSRDKKTGGFGLGLSIVKKLTELHGGRVGVDSEPGTGSTFSVIIPI